MKPILEPRKRRAPSVALAAVVAVAASVLWLASRPRPPSSIPRQALSLESVQRREPSSRHAPPPRLSPADQPVLAAAAAVPAMAAAERHFHFRDPQEWQGMLISTDAAPPCEASATCGLARACKVGKCVACAADDDCASGEACVLDHCVVRKLATCRSRGDCASGSLCILSGYSSEARGNEGMRSLCLNPASGASTIPAPQPSPPDPRTKLPDDELLHRADETAGARGGPVPR
jgi:hypothetical protein